MALTLYDLCGADPDLRFSPYCWRTRMALKHKGLEFDTVPIRFSDKDQLTFSGQDRVPVLVHDGHSVHDSWDIAVYLEETFADKPTLFGGPQGRALSRFHADWANLVLNPALTPLLVSDIHGVIHPDDKAYFRESREKRLGSTLEAIAAEAPAKGAALQKVLAPLRAVLTAQPYLAGDAPLYADFAVFGSFMWAAKVTKDDILAPGDPVAAWRSRMESRI